MRIVSKGQYYVVVHLTQAEAQSLGSGARFAVIDILYDVQPLLRNIIDTFASAQDAEQWISEHE